jgi:hypothetical protein
MWCYSLWLMVNWAGTTTTVVMYNKFYTEIKIMLYWNHFEILFKINVKYWKKSERKFVESYDNALSKGNYYKLGGRALILNRNIQFFFPQWLEQLCESQSPIQCPLFGYYASGAWISCCLTQCVHYMFIARDGQRGQVLPTFNTYIYKKRFAEFLICFHLISLKKIFKIHREFD